MKRIVLIASLMLATTQAHAGWWSDLITYINAGDDTTAIEGQVATNASGIAINTTAIADLDYRKAGTYEVGQNAGDIETNQDNIGINITDIAELDDRVTVLEGGVVVEQIHTRQAAGEWVMQTNWRNSDRMSCHFGFDESGYLIKDLDKYKCRIDKVLGFLDTDSDDDASIWPGWRGYDGEGDAKPHDDESPRNLETPHGWDSHEVAYSRLWAFTLNEAGEYRTAQVRHEFLSKDMNSSNGYLQFADGDQTQFTMIRIR